MNVTCIPLKIGKRTRAHLPLSAPYLLQRLSPACLVSFPFLPPSLPLSLLSLLLPASLPRRCDVVAMHFRFHLSVVLLFPFAPSAEIVLVLPCPPFSLPLLFHGLSVHCIGIHAFKPFKALSAFEAHRNSTALRVTMVNTFQASNRVTHQTNSRP